jgi:hypothetical protein
VIILYLFSINAIRDGYFRCSGQSLFQKYKAARVMMIG